MDTAIVLIVLLALVVAAIVLFSRRSARAKADRLADAKAEARRWVERLGGQVYALDSSVEPAAKQALADASERYNAAGGQVEQATTTRQCELATSTAMEGLYYVRAARTALGLDPGPELPEMNGQRSAGSVTEERKVNVEGHDYQASPQPGEQTPHYYPGGNVAGRPVPQGWYSEPWWKPALVAGAWGVGSMLLFDAMFSGMSGFGGGWGGFDGGFDSGYADGFQDGFNDGNDGFGGDAMADGGWDGSGGFDSGDGGAFDMGDGGGFDLGDW